MKRFFEVVSFFVVVQSGTMKRRLFLRPDFLPRSSRNMHQRVAENTNCSLAGENPRMKNLTRGDRGREIVTADVVATRAQTTNKSSPLELDEGLALADVALDGHHRAVALALVADVGAARVLAEAADQEDVT